MAQLELRKLGSERHTLRARLRREGDRLRELESALRAEKELRHRAADEHQAALAGLRARLAELDAEKSRELSRLEQELVAAREAGAAAVAAVPARVAKPVTGLRRIRGIGPAYERALESLSVTRVEQVAAWSDAEVERIAEQLRIRADRIYKDDWVGQAKLLEPDPKP